MNEEKPRYVWRHGKRIEVVTLNLDGIAPPRRKRTHTSENPEDRLIGCPVWWLQRIRPALETIDQLIVGLYVWRRWVVCGKRKTFTVPNGELKAWGISRHVKYRAIKRLAAAALLKIIQPRTPGEEKVATTVTILAEKPRRKS